MKLYLLTNRYCGGEHSGIQGIHSASRLMLKYTGTGVSEIFEQVHEQVLEWLDNHETVVLLNSGLDHVGLTAVADELEISESYIEQLSIRDPHLMSGNKLIPFATFNEPGLNETLTSLAVLCDTIQVSQMDALRNGLISDETIINNYGRVVGNLLIKMAYMRTM